VAAFRLERVGRFGVDPRSLSASIVIYNPDPGDHFAPHDPDSIRVRSELVLAAGLDTISSAPYKSCQFPRYRQPPSPACPRDSVTIALIGMPRVSDRSVPSSGGDSGGTGAVLHELRVRVVYLLLEPNGRDVNAYEYRVRQSASGWETVYKFRLVIVE
jgi:hypothetical protein